QLTPEVSPSLAPSPRPPTAAPTARPATPAPTPTTRRVFLPDAPQASNPPPTHSPTPPTPSTSPTSQPLTSTSDCAGLVTAHAGQFWLGGKPWTFTGVNISYLRSLPLPQVEESFKFLADHGATVVRTWVEPGADLDQMDRILDLGRRYGLRFVITFEDFWNTPKDTAWYAGGYRAEYLPHVEAVVRRYRDRPEVFLWQLMNEPTCAREGTTETCLAAMRGWVETSAVLVRSLDSCRPLAVGLIGIGGTLEREERHYRLMARLPGIDTLTVHRYAFEDPNEKLWRELAVAKAEGLPVVWGEVYEKAYDQGCRTLSPDALSKRASLIRRDLKRSFDAGVDGYLLWEFGYGALKRNGETKYYCGEFDYERDDPVWEVFKGFKPN
ncbi:MAG: beta-galactosidase, partial [Anaerolineae bacterium]|nr:beta-galactosidase [Anaerolineae bacterium]